MSVTPDEIQEMLRRHLPELDAVERDDGHLVVQVGGGVPGLVLDLTAVMGAEPLTTPWGAPALRITSLDSAGGAQITVMLLKGDVAFSPDPEAGLERVLPGRMRYTVGDLPPVIGYHEMVKYLAAAHEADDGDRLFAVTLAAASCLEGAHRTGLDVRDLDVELDALIARVRSY